MRKTEKAARGQKIWTETAPDRSSHKMNNDECLNGKKMGGGPLDLSSSLSTGKVGDGNYMDAAPKSRKD